MNKHTLQDKTAVIGDGAKNLGGLVSREFAESGAKYLVYYNSDATRPDAEATVGAIRHLGGAAFMLQSDLTGQADAAALLQQAKYFGDRDRYRSAGSPLPVRPGST